MRKQADTLVPVTGWAPTQSKSAMRARVPKERLVHTCSPDTMPHSLIHTGYVHRDTGRPHCQRVENYVHTRMPLTHPIEKPISDAPDATHVGPPQRRAETVFATICNNNQLAVPTGTAHKSICREREKPLGHTADVLARAATSSSSRHFMIGIIGPNSGTQSRCHSIADIDWYTPLTFFADRARILRRVVQNGNWDEVALRLLAGRGNLSLKGDLVAIVF